MQSRRMSLVEAALSTAIGLVVAFIAQVALFPVLGVYLTLTQNVTTTVVMTVVSVIRGYGVRRLFNWMGLRK